MDKIGDEDEGDNYQRGVDDDEDDESKGIQVLDTRFDRMHKWAV